nr:unnamed protein product [Callosobruchus chinensis]
MDLSGFLVVCTLRSPDVTYYVDGVKKIIANASRTQKFEVREVNTIEITNFKAWWPRSYKKNAVSLETRNLERTQKVHFNISKFHYFVYDSERSGTVKAAEFIKGVVEHIFDLNQNGNNIVLLPTTPCYPVGKVPIKQKKIDGFRQCIKYVEDPYKEFYNGVVSTWPTISTSNDDE